MYKEKAIQIQQIGCGVLGYIIKGGGSKDNIDTLHSWINKPERLICWKFYL